MNKFVVAIHGIGDQARNETILSTALRVCGYCDFGELLPLGGFYGTVPFVVTSAKAPPALKNIGFGEIYWADVGRDLEQNDYTLQESKAWAQSVVSRLRLVTERNRGKPPANRTIHYGQIEFVLDEMIDTIRTVESLLFLAKKAGIFSFDLNNLLNNYLGDVQLVAEYAPVRAEILKRLDGLLATIHQQFPAAEIHVIAHSEGTVISLLGLLQGLANPVQYPWIKQVKGYMTFGSPINKHLVLWPELFTGFTGPAPAVMNAGIRWFNYADYSDPVGFELDIAKKWLIRHGYSRALSVEKDCSFSRYPVPGAAHVGYWKDADVFDHFLLNVVSPPGAVNDPPPIARRTALANGPQGLLWPWITSYLIAYLIPILLVVAGVTCLALGVRHFDRTVATDHVQLISQVAAVSLLLCGVTVWLRIQQLTRWRAGGWHLFGLVFYAASAYGTHYVLQSNGGAFVAWLDPFPASFCSTPAGGLLATTGFLIGVVLLANARWLRKAAGAFTGGMGGRLAVSGSKSVVQYPGQHLPPVRNTLTLMIGLTALWLVYLAFRSWHDIASLPGGWLKLGLGIAGFLYLWRLAALVFDLVFVWHRYIRSAGLNEFLLNEVA